MCASGLLVSALVFIIILNDIFSYKINYLFEHSVLGAIVCILFFTLCNYGLEQVNWIFLALIPLSIFIKWMYTLSVTADNECEVCQESIHTYDYSYRNSMAQAQAQAQAQALTKTQPQVAMTPGLNCPAKPLTLSTKCGISRYYE